MSDVKGIKASVQSIDVIHAEIESNLQRVRYETEEVNVEPSTKEQTILASPEKYIDKVNVKPVTASVDKNIVPENIKVNENILGTRGTFTEDATATADDIMKNKTAYVNGEKIEGNYVPPDTSDATATADDIMSPKTAYVNGEKIEGKILPSYTYIKEIRSGENIINSVSKRIMSVHHDKFVVCKDDTTVYIYELQNGVIGSLIYQFALTDIGGGKQYQTRFETIIDVDIADNPIPDTEENYYLVVGTHFFNGAGFVDNTAYIVKLDLANKRILEYGIVNSYMSVRSAKNVKVQFFENTHNRFVFVYAIHTDSMKYNYYVYQKEEGQDSTLITSFTTSAAANNPYGNEYKASLGVQAKGDYILVTGANKTSFGRRKAMSLRKIDWTELTNTVIKETTELTENIALLDEHYLYNNELYSLDDPSSCLATFDNLTYETATYGIIYAIDNNLVSFVPTNQMLYTYKLNDDLTLTKLSEAAYGTSTTFLDAQDSLVIPKVCLNRLYYAVANTDNSNIGSFKLDIIGSTMKSINIKDSIFYDTRDATVTAEEILKGKTAYGSNGKITGKYIPLDTSDATATAEDIRAGKTAYINGVKVVGTLTNIDEEETEYTQLDYIASTGTQYIDTGLTFNNSNFSYEIKFRLTSITEGGSILGINKSVSSLTISNGKFMLNGTVLTDADTNLHTLKYNRSTGSVNLDGTEYSVSTSLTDAGTNLDIFRRSGSATSNTSLELYYFKLYDIENTLLRDFIPVKDTSEFACLFEKVNSEYYYNQGTGTFVAGSEVIDG